MSFRFACLLLICLLNQRCTTTRYRLIYHDGAEGYTIGDSELKAVHLNPFNARIYTTTVAGQKQTAEAGRFWGYQDNTGIKYRIYAHGIFEVVQEKKMTIYRQCNEGAGFNDSYFFSVGPNEPILYLNVVNLKKAFKNDPCMLDLAQKMPLRHWFKTDAAGTFLLLDAFGYCQRQAHSEPWVTP